MKRLLLILFLLVTAVSCAAPAAEPTAIPEPTATLTCADLSVDYRAAVDGITARWDDANALAGSTARMNLSGPVGSLQEIAREVEALEPPPCANEAHRLLNDYMRRAVDGYLGFMAQEANAENKLNQANNILKQWAEEYAALTK